MKYKARREEITNVAFVYRIGDAEIPSIDYNEDELRTWAYCYPKLKALLKTNACVETN